MTFSLFKIFLSNMFNPEDFIQGFKKGPKGIGKNLLIIFLFVYCAGAFGFIYINQMLNLYNGLEEVGKTYIMPVAALMISLVITFFFGFLSVATNYCTGSGEEQLLSMPLSPRQIFTAKFWISVVADSIFGVLLLAVACVIYGVKEGLFTKPGFYAGFIITALTTCVVSILIIFALFIIILTLIPALRKKSFLQGVASFLVIIFAASGGFIGSATGASSSTSPIMNLGSIIANSSAGRLAETKAMQIFGQALTGNWISILIMAAITLVVVFGIVPLLSPLYIKTLAGFSDVKTKKIDAKEAEKVLKTELKENSLFKTVLIRDIKTVLREPAFFANGPLLILLLPVIMVFPIIFTFIQAGENLAELGVALKGFLYTDLFITKGSYYITLGMSAFVVFMGNSTSLAATSFSREGKSLYDLKAMPIETKTIVFAKFSHAFMYVIISNVVAALFASGIFAGLGIAEEIKLLVPCFVKMLILSVVISIVLVVGEMFLDTINPKLNWENPIAAFKQNVNSMISVFITLFIVAIIVILGIFLLPKNNIGYVILVAVFAAIAVPLSLLYIKYVEKRFMTI